MSLVDIQFSYKEDMYSCRCKNVQELHLPSVSYPWSTLRLYKYTELYGIINLLSSCKKFSI